MWAAMKSALTDLWRGYTRASALALVALALGYAIIAFTYRRYIDLSLGMDWLLAGIWLFMTALLCWGIEPRRDLIRAAVGFGGGLYIEAWGTQTEIWTYFTDERPPLWILPAWPVAAIAIDRLSRALDIVWPAKKLDWLWWALLPAFVPLMTLFVWPHADHSFTQLSIVLMVVVLLWRGDVRQDLTLMVAGAGLGIFLEYWGTSRYCWTYYTKEIPPIQAVLAHGFASVAFQRVVYLGENMLSRLKRPPDRDRSIGTART